MRLVLLLTFLELVKQDLVTLKVKNGLAEPIADQLGFNGEFYFT